MLVSSHSANKPLKHGQRASRFTLLNICLIAGTTLLLVTETVLTNNQVAIGGQSNALLQQKSQLADQVSQLSREVSHYKSLLYISAQATEKFKMEPLQKNLWYLPNPGEAKP